MINVGILLAAALAVAIAFGLLVSLTRAYPVVGGVMCAVTVLPAYDFPQLLPLASVFGSQVFLGDVTTLVLLAVGLLNYRRVAENLGQLNAAWLGLGCLIALSLIRGVADFGIGTAVNEARSVLSVYFAFTWGLSVDWRGVDLRRWSLVIGWLLTSVAVYHLAGGGASISEASLGEEGRALVSNQAIIVAVCAAVLVFDQRRSHRLVNRLAAAAFFAIVVITRHRSVWTATIAGIGVVLIASRSAKMRTRALEIALGAAVIGALAVATGALGEVWDQLVLAAGDTRTYDARTTSWEQLVGQSFDDGVVSVLLGRPFGTGFLRLEPNGIWTTYSPHNWYVLLFLRVGLLGLILWCLVVLRGILRSRLAGGSVLATSIALATYGWAYSVPWFAAPWFSRGFVAAVEPAEAAVVNTGLGRLRASGSLRGSRNRE